MKTFNMSKYATELDLYKDKANYYQELHAKLVSMANPIMNEIMPQAGKLVFQDYGRLNELLMHLTKHTK
jgi:hypothetical protein